MWPVFVFSEEINIYIYIYVYIYMCVYRIWYEIPNKGWYAPKDKKYWTKLYEKKDLPDPSCETDDRILQQIWSTF